MGFWSRPDARLARKVVAVIVGAFVIGYVASSLWMWAGSSDRTVVTVPNLRELSLAQARGAVDAAELVLETADSLPHPEVADGHVLTQSPLPGQEVAPGTAVQIILSSGQARHAVPQVAGFSREQAEQVLRATGMRPLVEEVHDRARAGLAVGTIPSAGAVLAVPTDVRLQVSQGPPLVVVPDLVAAREADLPALLGTDDLGLGDVRREFRMMEPEGQIVRQDPAAGDSVPQGSVVDVWVATTRLEMLAPQEIR